MARAWLVLVLVLAVWAPARASAQETPEITAQGAVLWEPATDTVLVDVAAEQGRPMASTTKIMTAMLALEATDPDEVVTVSQAAAEVGRVPGAATLRLAAGQQLPMSSLLAGLVLVSGNDAAVAVADHVAGDEAAFVERMNGRASELGLSQTHFVNSSGLTDDPAHHASPMDLARLAHHAMRFEEFAELAGSASLDVAGLGEIDSRNELLSEYPGATGVKTGFTSLAGLCLVASAERDGRTLYAIVLDSEDSFADAAALLDHGFDEHRLVEVDGRSLPPYRWNAGASELVLSSPLVATVPRAAQLRATLELTPRLDLPATAGTTAGELVVQAGEEPLDRLPVTLAETVEPVRPTHPAARVGTHISDGLRALARTEPRETVLAGVD